VPAFLSDDWVKQAREIRVELEGQLPEAKTQLRINMNVTKLPAGVGDGGDSLAAHIDTTDSAIDLEVGHLDGDVDATLTLDYETAKAIIVSGKVEAAMQAFMAGQLKIEGDMMKVMAMQTELQNTELEVLHSRFTAITD
jgi:putative sterol carrier protein